MFTCDKSLSSVVNLELNLLLHCLIGWVPGMVLSCLAIRELTALSHQISQPGYLSGLLAGDRDCFLRPPGAAAEQAGEGAQQGHVSGPCRFPFVDGASCGLCPSLPAASCPHSFGLCENLRDGWW